jgi:glucose-6-phosphate 1-dehydrogenase
MSHFRLVIIGGSGDLSLRKLIPSLYACHLERHLGDGTIHALGRKSFTDAEFCDLICDRNETIDRNNDFFQRLKYHQFDAMNDQDYSRLSDELPNAKTTIFYFSTSPDLFPIIAEGIAQNGLVDDNTRVVLEKPLGDSHESSVQLSDSIESHIEPCKIYRIDHYLGKESVQNLMVLRFANAVIEPLWNRNYIDHVQITVAETVGVEGRADYYDRYGALRDIIQNHMLQLLCLIAMEPPADDKPESILAEKVQVLRSLKPLKGAAARRDTVRAQYAASEAKSTGYINEMGVATDSQTETFVAIKMQIDNWRWAGVPFYIRTGKCMERRLSEVVIQFKEVPHWTLNVAKKNRKANRIVIRLQPDESIQLLMQIKQPGPKSLELKQVPLDLYYADSIDARLPDAYERLLLDVIEGNSTLFMDREEVELAWKWCDGVLEAWKDDTMPLHSYPAGTWGPEEADLLIAKHKNSFWGYGQGGED